jgi:hypothetical protein
MKSLGYKTFFTRATSEGDATLVALERRVVLGVLVRLLHCIVPHLDIEREWGLHPSLFSMTLEKTRHFF